MRNAGLRFSAITLMIAPWLSGCGLSGEDVAGSKFACRSFPADFIAEVTQSYETFRDNGGTLDSALTDSDAGPEALCDTAVDALNDEADGALTATEIAGLRTECVACLTAIINEVYQR